MDFREKEGREHGRANNKTLSTPEDTHQYIPGAVLVAPTAGYR